MKFKRKETDSKDFEPITIEITFESEDELLCWWHRFNIGWDQIVNLAPSEYNYHFPDKDTTESDLWDLLDEIRVEGGISA